MKKKKTKKKNKTFIKVVFIILFLVLLFYNLKYLMETPSEKGDEEKQIDSAAKWIECDKGNIGVIQEWDNYKFKCVQENNEFKWIDIS